MPYRANLLILAALTVLSTTACAPRPPAIQQPTQPVDITDLISKHNANAAMIDQIWARAVVELRWHDEKGKHFEQGEGNLLVILPDRVALSIGKLGHTMFWIGCDQERYWLFDLRDKNDRTLYHGRHDDPNNRALARLPIPVSPLDLVRLLGVQPIDPNRLITRDAPWTTPPDTDPGYLIQTFVTNDPTQRAHHLLGPTTALPISIELTDTLRDQRVAARLSRYKKLKRHGVPPGGYPDIPTRIEITHPDQQGTATLFLSSVTDGRAHDRIKPRAFDLAKLTKILKPQETINLDTTD